MIFFPRSFHSSIKKNGEEGCKGGEKKPTTLENKIGKLTEWLRCEDEIRIKDNILRINIHSDPAL